MKLEIWKDDEKTVFRTNRKPFLFLIIEKDFPLSPREISLILCCERRQK